MKSSKPRKPALALPWERLRSWGKNRSGRIIEAKSGRTVIADRVVATPEMEEKARLAMERDKSAQDAYRIQPVDISEDEFFVEDPVMGIKTALRPPTHTPGLWLKDSVRND